MQPDVKGDLVRKACYALSSQICMASLCDPNTRLLCSTRTNEMWDNSKEGIPQSPRASQGDCPSSRCILTINMFAVHGRQLSMHGNMRKSETLSRLSASIYSWNTVTSTALLSVCIYQLPVCDCVAHEDLGSTRRFTLNEVLDTT